MANCSNANSSCLSDGIFAGVFGSLRDSLKRIGCIGDFVGSRPSAERKTNGRSGAFHWQSHGEQNMRCPYRANHASRTTRRANALQIQSHQHRFRIHADKTYVERVAEPVSMVAILLRVREKLCDAFPEIITQLRFALALCIGVAHDPLGGRSHSRYAGDVFCSRAPLIFVRAAKHDRLNRQTAPQEQKSRSLWTVKFMRRE